MRGHLILGIALIISLASYVGATSPCPCNLPGESGTPIRFLAREGTAENVTFYTYDEPTLGSTIQLWAMQERRTAVIPIENLTVSIYRNSEKILQKSTNAEGGTIFVIDSPGNYEFRGGDGFFSFGVIGNEEENISETNDTGPPETTVPLNITPPGAAENPAEGRTPGNEDKPGTTATDFPISWTYLITAVLLIALIYIAWRKRR